MAFLGSILFVLPPDRGRSLSAGRSQQVVEERQYRSDSYGDDDRFPRQRSVTAPAFVEVDDRRLAGAVLPQQGRKGGHQGEDEEKV